MAVDELRGRGIGRGERRHHEDDRHLDKQDDDEPGVAAPHLTVDARHPRAP
jgi:hypothetical protein